MAGTKKWGGGVLVWSCEGQFTWEKMRGGICGRCLFYWVGPVMHFHARLQHDLSFLSVSIRLLFSASF